MEKFKRLLSDRKMFIVFLMGFSSGLPYLLTGATMQAWLKDSQMDITHIGLFALVGLPYSLKFFWSPILDSITPPFLGRRRGWMLISQVALFGAILAIAFCHPALSLLPLTVLAILVAFLSASQDISIDAYQIEVLPPEAYGLGNQIYTLGYRIGMIAAGSGALILADTTSWRAAYFVMAGAMAIGIVTTFFAEEPTVLLKPKRGFKAAVWEPLQDFFSPTGSQAGRALWIIGFFLMYKFGCDMATSLATPFYMDLGFSKMQIGAVAKVFGLGATIVGGLIGGAAIVSMGIKRSLWAFGLLQGIASLVFAWLAHTTLASGTTSIVSLATAITIENLASGLGTAAYSTYMGSIVNRKFTATQYALLSSLMGATRLFSAAPSGWLQNKLGWETFFVVSTVAALPGLLLLLKLNPPSTREEVPETSAITPDLENAFTLLTMEAAPTSAIIATAALHEPTTKDYQA